MEVVHDVKSTQPWFDDVWNGDEDFEQKQDDQVGAD